MLNATKGYKKIVLCGNTFTDVKSVLMLGGVNIFSFEKDVIPKLTLSVPVKSQKASKKVIIRNQPIDSRFRVVENKIGASANFFYLNSKICVVEGAGLDEVNIPMLDLRPLGFLIYGDDSGLYLGNSLYSRNSFSRTAVAFDLR